MSRNSLTSKVMFNFWLDATLLFLFTIQLCVGTIVRFVFPAATSADQWSLWSLSLENWMDVQFGVMCVFTLGIVLHLMLHWTWVCSIVSSLRSSKSGAKRVMDDGARTIFGVGTLIVLLNLMGLVIGAAVLSIQGPP